MNQPVSRLGASPEEGIKAPCVVATTANITLSGEQTVNSVSVVSGNRVLVMNQTDPVENGIYVASTTAWTRATDFNAASDVINGVLVLSSNNSYVWQAFFTGTYAPDITSLTFARNVFSDLQSEQFFYDNHASSAKNAYAIKVPAAKTTPSTYLANIMMTFRPSHQNDSTSVTVRVLGQSGLLATLPYVMEDGSTLPAIGFLTIDRDVTVRIASDLSKVIHVSKKIDVTPVTFTNIGGSARNNTDLTAELNILSTADHKYNTNHASSAADSYVISPTVSPLPAAWVTGHIYEWTPSHLSTGAFTVNIYGLSGLVGAKSYKMADGTNPTAGFAKPEVSMRARYDGTNLVHLDRGFVAQTWGTSDINDDAITLAKMASGTPNKLIGYNSSGDPAVIDRIPRLLDSASIGATDSFIRFILSSLDATQAVGNTYKIKLFGIQPATDNKDLLMLMSIDGGTNYLTSYYWSITEAIVTSTTNTGSASDSSITVADGYSGASLSNATNEVVSMEIDLINVNTGTSVMPSATWRGTCWDSNGTARPVRFQGSAGTLVSAVGDIDTIKLSLESGGNFASGVGRWEIWKTG